MLELHSWKVVLHPLVFSLDLVEFLLIWSESKPRCERWPLYYPQLQTHPHPRILFSTGQELDLEEASFSYTASAVAFSRSSLSVSHSNENMNNLEVACICCLFSKLQKERVFLIFKSYFLVSSSMMF